MTNGPLIVAVGGTLVSSSSTQKALSAVLRAAEKRGARTMIVTGQALNLPLYEYPAKARGPEAVAMVAALAQADGIILGSPSYHGTISGLVKNALDYVEDLREDPRPYFTGRAVGCVAMAGGWQGAVHTLGVLRDIVHALRGWPTPMGIAINGAETTFDHEGNCSDPRTAEMLDMMAAEIIDFVEKRSAA